MKKTLENSQSYCAFLFSQVTTDNSGFFSSCCHFSKKFINKNGDEVSAENQSPLEFLNSNKMNYLRKKINQNEPIGGCRGCYQQESAGAESPRQRANRELPRISNHEDDKLFQIVSLDLRLGNLCNLGCVMCAPYASSYLDFEWKKNDPKGFSNELQTVFSGVAEQLINWHKDPAVFQKIIDSLDNINFLKFIGGEPLINRYYLLILDSLIARGKSLQIEGSSNITVLKEEVLTRLERHTTHIKASIDGTDRTYEYIRYPGIFSNIERNLKALIHRNFKTIEVVFTPTVLNILNLKDFYFWTVDIFKESSVEYILSVENILTRLNHLAIKNLDSKTKLLVVKDLDKIIEHAMNVKFNYVSIDSMRRLSSYLIAETGNPQILRAGWKYIEHFDKVRRTSWKNVAPWIESSLYERGDGGLINEKNSFN